MPNPSLLHLFLSDSVRDKIDAISAKRRESRPKLRNLTKAERKAAQKILRFEGQIAAAKYVDSLNRQALKDHRSSRTRIALELIETGLKHTNK